MTAAALMKSTRLPLLFLLSSLLHLSCGTDQKGPFRQESTAMDTFVSVSIYDDVESENAAGLADAALVEIRRVEAMATDYNDSSEIGQINLRAGRDTTRVSKELAGLITASVAYSENSDGAFDITVGPIVKAWDFLSDHPEVVEATTLDRLLELVDYRLISLRNDKVYLPKQGMRLDLGAIAKGYAVDQALQVLRTGGLRRAIIDLGGNLGVYWEGTRLLDSTKATIFVRHPRREGEMFGHFDVGTAGVSTSGDYQRFFVRDGVRYHHIIDPQTGLPVRDVVSVTIISPDAMSADALSTTIFVLGREEGLKRIETLPYVEGLIVYEQGDSLAYDVSSGLKGKFVREGGDD